MADVTMLIDHLELDAISPCAGDPLMIVDLSSANAVRRAAATTGAAQAIIIGFDRSGECPKVDPADFDCLLTTSASAKAPWISVVSCPIDDAIARLRQAVGSAPVAAAMLCHVLRIGERVTLRDALAIESMAYSTLLGGAAFRDWRLRNPAALQSQRINRSPFVEITRNQDMVTITLARAGTRNKMCHGMRDALFEALASVLDDPSLPTLNLRGAGNCFSIGGDLDEFGTATDLAAAHSTRLQRSCAALLAEIGNRSRVLLHGACIGSGIEVAAAAAHRRATPSAFFQLPELKLGLIPGAGGTATISRAIGRHRTCWMAMSGRRISAGRALEWGLIHAIEPAHGQG